MKAYLIGGRDALRRQLEGVVGVPVERRWPDAGSRADVLFLHAACSRDDGAALPGGNAFTACRRLKDDLGVRVFVLVEAGDTITPEIARFCLADGCCELTGQGEVADPAALAERLAPHRPRVSVDSLLARLEAEIASDEGRQRSALQRMLDEGDKPRLLDRLVDPDTGLFDGPFTSFKLDEEFKRAMRFHQPLSLMLLDVGADLARALPQEQARRSFLAEVASVFLNECRDIDVLGRFTASTFLVLMPGTGPAGAEVVARRMLEGVREKRARFGVTGDPHGALVTVPAAGIKDREAFLARAEACLRLAAEGRGEQGFCSAAE